MNKKIQEQVEKEMNLMFPLSKEPVMLEFAIRRTKELMEDKKKLDTCSICKIIMGKEMLTKECPNCYLKGCNLELTKQKADFRKMIFDLIDKEILEEEKAVKNKVVRDWNIVRELTFIKREIAKLNNNGQQGKKNEKGFSYQDHLETRIKAGADNRKENMPVDEDNHLVDTNDDEVKFTKIYLEGDEFFIAMILDKAKDDLGSGCNVINLNPELKEEEE